MRFIAFYLHRVEYPRGETLPNPSITLDRVLRFSDLEKKVRQIVERARVDYADFLSSGRITDELVESALLLAQVDTIFRAKVVDKNLGDVHKEDIEDLSKLISLIDPQFFEASRLCLLNPTFGEASSLVGGADADLVIDNAIIDTLIASSCSYR